MRQKPKKYDWTTKILNGQNIGLQMCVGVYSALEMEK